MASPRKASVRFRERVELLDFLLEVSRVTSETLDLDQLLANVGSIVKDVISYDLFAILLYNERQQGLSIRYSIGHREEVVRSVIIKLDEGITGAAAASRTPVMVDDVRQDARYLNALDAVAQRTRGADDGARQTGGRNRRTVHSSKSVFGTGSRDVAINRGARRILHR